MDRAVPHWQVRRRLPADQESLVVPVVLVVRAGHVQLGRFAQVARADLDYPVVRECQGLPVVQVGQDFQ